MHIHYEELSDVARYIEKHADITLEEQKPTLENILNNIKRHKNLNGESRILEIGVGSGWFQIYCKQQGLNIRGLEISPQLLEVAREYGRRHEMELDLEVGNIEDTDIGMATYDVIVASSVFEHVEDWQKGVQKIFAALKPGGLFYFDSTNKFSLYRESITFPSMAGCPITGATRCAKRAREPMS